MAFDRSTWLFVRTDPIFAKRLAETYSRLRKAQRLTQEDVARLDGGVTTKTIQRLEQERIDQLSYEKFSALSRAIGLTVDLLIAKTTQRGLLAAQLPGQQPQPPYITFLEQQKHSILNSSLLPWTQKMQVSLRFIWPELIVPAPVRFLRSPQDSDVSKWGLAKLGVHRVSVIGVPGSGKTTSLRYLALTLINAFLNDETTSYPIYFHVRDSQKWLPGRRNSKERRGLAIPPGAEIVFLADGIDEISLATRRAALRELVQKCPPSDILIIACRSDVFQQLTEDTYVNDAFDEIVELVGWDFERHVKPYAAEYCRKLGRPSDYSKLIESCLKIPRLQEFVSNPFHLTLVLFIIQSRRDLDEQLFLNRFSVYREFYKNWLVRERKRGTSSLHSARIVELHRAVGQLLYVRKPAPIPVVEIRKLIYQFKDVIEDSAFRGLLQISQEPLSASVRIESFRHETLLEYILAEQIVSSLSVGGAALKTVFSIEYNNDVNTFVREGLSLLTLGERWATAKQLEQTYKQYLGASRGTSKRRLGKSDDGTRTREQLIYYIGRLDLDRCPQLLRTVSTNDPDRLVRRAAALGAILHGDEQLEDEYVSSVLTDPNADLLNRSVQLVYFGDTKSSIYGFSDDGDCDWAKARVAIIDRLKSASKRDLRLRKWDLATLFSFLKSRPTARLHNVELDIIGRALCTSAEYSDQRKRKLERLKSQIINLGAGAKGRDRRQ